MTKRVFAALLALVMLFSALPMSVFAEDVAQTLDEPTMQTLDKPTEEDEDGIAPTELDTGHMIDVRFTILYVDDADFKIGYNYGTSEKTQFVCQYTTSHSDTAYNNHTIAISDIKAAADRATVNSGYQIVGWSKEANADPKVWSLNKSGTTACNKGTTIYLVAKNPIPTVTYELFYNKNDGITGTCGSDASLPTRAESFKFTVRTKAELSPTREGYTFLGWSKDPTATATEYTGGEPITLYKAKPRLDLFAVWEKDEPQHEHDWEWKDNGNGTHTGNCKDPNCDATTTEPHVDKGDGTCGKCGACMHPHENGYCTKSDCDHTEKGYNCCPKKEDPQPDVPTEFGKEQLAAMQVNVQCETDAAHAKIYHFGELDGCYSTSDIMTDSNGGYYVTVTLNRSSVVAKFNADEAAGGKIHDDTQPNASTSWTWTWNASEKTWKMDNAPMTDAWATIVVKCNGSQPEVKPTVPTVTQLLGGFVIRCVSSGKHNLDAGSIGLSVALQSVSTVGTYEVVSTEATKGTDGRYYVEVKVNNVDAYLPQYEQAVSNIEHERNDGVSNELTLTYYYNEETKAWAQDSEPVVDVKCKEEELIPVELVIFRNGDTSTAYKTVRVANVEKGTVIKTADYPIGKYYDGTNSGGKYDFYGWYDDGLWNIYKQDLTKQLAGLTEKTVNGWTNLKCMVYDYEKVVYFQTEEALTDYQNDHSKTDGLLYTTTARKGDTLPTTDAPAATREGYTFQYWSREGQTSNVSGQTVNGWTNLYANWEKIPTPDVSEIDFTGKQIYVKCDIYGGEHGEFIDYIPGSYRIDWDGVSARANLVFTSATYLAASKYADDHALASASDPEVSTQIVFENGQWTQKTNGPTVQVSCQATLTYDGNKPANASESAAVEDVPDAVKQTLTDKATKTTVIALSNETPSLNGYKFLGWATTADATTPDYPVENKTDAAKWCITVGYEGKTLYAVWQEKTFFVGYWLKDKNGEWQRVHSENVPYTKATTHPLWMPTIPDGYAFDGWYQDEKDVGKEGKPKFTTTTQAKKWEFYADFTAIEYEIHYEYRDKDIAEKKLYPDNKMTYTVKDTVTLKDIEADGEHGKKFVEWRCDLNKDGVAEKITVIPKGTTGNLIISAHWNYPVNYTVFDANGDKIDSLSKTEYVFEDVLRSEEGYKLTALTQDGYTFDGWYQDDDDLGKTEKLIKDQTLKGAKKWELYGKLTPKEYTVVASMYLNGAEKDGVNNFYKEPGAKYAWSTNVSGKFGEGIDYATMLAAIKAKAEEAAGGTAKVKICLAGHKDVDATTALVKYGDLLDPAVWAPPYNNIWQKRDFGEITYLLAYADTYYDVTFDTTVEDLTVPKQVIKYGETATEPAAPSREGYKFLGWYEGDVKFDFENTKITKETKLTAKWEKLYKIVYHGVNGTVESGWLEYDTEYTLRANSFTDLPHTFLGWATAANSDTVAYTDGQKVKFTKTDAVNDEVHLYAVWTHTLTIKYLNKKNDEELDRYEVELANGRSIDVTYPTIKGYRLYERETHHVYTMGDSDVTYIVYYVKRSTGNGGGTYDSPNKTKKTSPALTLNTADHFAFINGYPDGSVQPEGNVTRAETAAILYRIMGDDCQSYYKTTSCSYSDVARGDWFNTYVATLENAGVIVDTRTNGKFRPNDAITRAELASMIAQFAGLDSASAAGFNDVGTIYWAAKEIAIAAKVGWINGYPDGSFRPDQNVTRAELMAMVNRALGRTPKSEDDLLSGMKTWRDNANVKAWYYLDVQEATNDHTYTKSGNHETWKKLL